jgi:erythromycin esterase
VLLRAPVAANKAAALFNQPVQVPMIHRPDLVRRSFTAPLLAALAGLAGAMPLGAADSGDEKDSDAVVIGWLRRGAVVLRSTHPGAGLEDLKPLKGVLQGVRVVGFGEATHGTREFVQLRHRFLEFLVQEMGFTALAMEFSAADGYLINDYVLHGRSSREQVCACLSKIWITDTQELTAVIDWMREHNGRTAVEKRVQLFGIDPQANGRAMEVVRAYLRKTAPERLRPAEDLFRGLSEQDANALAFAPTSVPQAQLAELYKLISYLVLHRDSLISLSSATEWGQAVEHLRLLAQFAEFNSPTPVDGGGTRDGYMAENFLAALRRQQPGTRVVLWAHNAHVCKRDTGRFPALGSYLHKAFGKGYYALGFSFDHGSFRAQLPRRQPPQQEIFTLGPAPAGTIDWVLARVGIASYVVDLRNPPTEPRIAAWLKTPQNLHWAGVFFTHESATTASGRPFLLSRDFDGLIFLESGTPTRRASPTRGASGR